MYGAFRSGLTSYSSSNFSPLLSFFVPSKRAVSSSLCAQTWTLHSLPSLQSSIPLRFGTLASVFAGGALLVASFIFTHTKTFKIYVKIQDLGATLLRPPNTETSRSLLPILFLFSSPLLCALLLENRFPPIPSVSLSAPTQCPPSPTTESGAARKIARPP